MKGQGGVKRAKPQEILNKGLIEIGAAGVGCVLIEREVLKKVKFRYEPDKKAFDDMFFYLDAKKAGYKIYVEGNIRVEHLFSPWKGIKK